MKNPVGQLAITALLALVVLTACSGGSPPDYAEQVGHIMQAHLSEFALANDALAACAPTSRDALADCGADVVLALDRYERVSSVHMEKWGAELQPPEEALQFHVLTLELFQLRFAAFHTIRRQVKGLTENPSKRITPMMTENAAQVADQFFRADRLVVRILAEARKLGWD